MSEKEDIMKRFKIVALTVGLMVALAMTVGLAQAKSLDEILKAGEIRVGINPTLPPLGVYNDKNEIDGFDKDVAQAIADALKVKLTIVKVGSPDRIPFVASDKIDFVMGAMTRNPQRAQIIDFTVPVHTEVFGVLTTSENKRADWRDYNDPNITLVQVRGTTPVPFIEKNLPKAKVLLLDNYPDVIRAIAQGRGQAMLDVVDFMWGHTATHKNVKWEVVDTPVNVYFCCLGVAKGNYTLRDWLNVQLFEMHRNGDIDKFWEKWFGGPMIFKVPATAWF
jgi:polar amino acid transport system substrate-binding protein